jgi:hypothetical protein
MENIEREMLEKARKVRPHASYFEWPNKQTKELGVVRALLESAREDARLAFREIQLGDPDPPDAIGTRADGARAAIEVTELIDEEVTAHNVRVARETEGLEVIERLKGRVERVWEEAEFVAAIDERLRAKDGKTLQGGPFAQYIVAMQTDEAMLTPADAAGWLAGRTFTGMKQITDAYLLFSHRPDVDGCPHIRLNVGP